MARHTLMDEIHVTVLAPRGLPEARYTAIQQTLQRVRFRAQLRDAVKGVCRAYRSLNRVRITVTR